MTLAVLLLGLLQAPPRDLVEKEPVSGVTLVFERDGDIDVDTWGIDFTIPVVKTLTPAEIERTRRLVSRAAAKYPPGFLRKRLDRIYICGSLSVDDFEYGATYDHRTLYIVDGGAPAGFDDRFIEQSFHHEFSSVLMYEPDANFPTDKWNGLNPKSFSYKGYDAVYNDKHGEVDWEEQQPQWLRMGFVKRYSMTSVEEDLNTVAESIFAGGPKFWRQVDQNPHLKSKIRLAISFYHGLDKWFGEKRFRAFAALKG